MAADITEILVKIPGRTAPSSVAVAANGVRQEIRTNEAYQIP